MKKARKIKKNISAGGERKFMEERGFEYIGNAKDFKMPKWMDCIWRRNACEKFTCKICGKIQQDRLAHVIKGEDPDDMENVLEDVGRSFKETLLLIKQDAERRGIDLANINEDEIQEPPEPKEFPLYRKLNRWHTRASKLLKKAENENKPWLLTEAGADLMWYRNTLLMKTYRQLCNRWELDRGDEYGQVDFEYTKYVLGECFKILKKSLEELYISLEIKEFKVLLNQILRLEKEIMII